MRITYLFNTFPLLSETFLQREIRAMRALGVELDLHSIHQGETSFEGHAVRRFPKWELVKLLWYLPLCLVQKPCALLHALKPLLTHPPQSGLNIAENLLGLGFAIVRAQAFKKNPPDLYHATWATMPATAALFLSVYTHRPFSMGAHAYDVFRDGGDWILVHKCKRAKRIHTSTEATRAELIKRGVTQEKITLIRRGFDTLPEFTPSTQWDTPLRLISVGRLIEKKGYLEQIDIYHHLKTQGFAFEAKIIGGGLLEKKIRARIEQYDLQQEVKLLGALDQTAVQEHLKAAHVMLFTGKITHDGDRDGLPNVIPEAMAQGVCVLATPVSGVPEAIQNDETGILLSLNNQQAWLEQLIRLREDALLRTQLQTQARAWVETHFSAHKNTQKLLEHLTASIQN